MRCQSLSTMKLGFLGLSEATKKPRMVRFQRQSKLIPFWTLSLFEILSQGLPKYDSSTQGVFRGREKDWRCQILLPVTASSLFGHFEIIQISKKTKRVTGNRTRDVATEGLDVLHYAIRSLKTSIFYWIIIFLGITDTVTYLTIYDKFMLSRKIQKLRKYFFD